MSKVCDSIEKVRGGYIVTLPFPWGSYHDQGKVVVQTFTGSDRVTAEGGE